MCDNAPVQANIDIERRPLQQPGAKLAQNEIEYDRHARADHQAVERADSGVHHHTVVNLQHKYRDGDGQQAHERGNDQYPGKHRTNCLKNLGTSHGLAIASTPLISAQRRTAGPAGYRIM